ncbi:hypothetical protein ACFCXP_11325 [Streptomyces niveus]|uniref:hypothetical protein n=1 Tax=Streptomyces niveus TaxID=193462 RepID=UPI0035DD9728
MRDTLDLISALVSPLGVWLIVTFLLGVAMQVILLCAVAAGIARRTAGMVRTVRARRRERPAAQTDAEGEWVVSSPPPGT